MPDDNSYGITPSFRPEEYVWLRQRLKIDQMAIDKEIIEMPELIQKAGEYVSTAIEIREAAENELKHEQAAVAERLRLTPNIGKDGKQDGKTRSEAQIASEVPLSDLVREKQMELSTARLDAALWSILVESLRRKDSGIRVMADLISARFITADHILDKRRQEIRNAKV